MIQPTGCRSHQPQSNIGRKAYSPSRRAVCKMLKNARQRAKKTGRIFSLIESDIVLPDSCPCCGRAFFFGATRQNDASPSLDRINNDVGYVPGNSVVCCWACNFRKGNSSLDELRLLVRWLEGLEGVT